MTTDGHEDIIAEHNLNQDGVRGLNIVRTEIPPPNRNFAAPPETWRFKIDQDILPEWAVPDVIETRSRAALTDWIAKRVIRESCESLCNGRFYVCGSARVEHVYGSAVVERVYGSARVEHVGDSAVVGSVGGSARVEHIGDSAVVGSVGDSARVEHIGGSAVVERVCGSAIVRKYSPSAMVAHPSGPHAVVIDSTDDRSTCIVGE